MKYRIHIWASVRTGTKSYGLQCQTQKGKRFMHCCAEVNGISRSLIYIEKARAESLVKSLNAGESPELEAGLVPLRD